MNNSLLRDPLFVYLLGMTFLCILSIATVIIAVRALNRDSVIEDPLATTLEELEAIYDRPFITENQRVPMRGGADG